MGYEVKKVIEFGQENTKPVGLMKGALLLKDGKELALQLKLRNNGKDILNRVTIEITCIGKDGQVIGKQNYTYEKVFITSGSEFGTDVAISLKYNSVESVLVEVGKNLGILKVNCKKVFRSKHPVWFSKVYNGTVAFLSMLFLVYHLAVLMRWNLLIKQQEYDIPWFPPGREFGAQVQLYLVLPATSVLCLYSIVQVFLNKKEISYRKLLISNLTQILMIFIFLFVAVSPIDEEPQYYIYMLGSLILVLMHAIMIQSIRDKTYVLLIGLTGLFLALIYYVSGSSFDYNVPKVIIFYEFFKFGISIIGEFEIIRKKFKIR